MSWQPHASCRVCYTFFDAGVCDETLALEPNIAINASITTCIECSIEGTPATRLQWFAGGAQVVSGQNGATIENGVLVINDAEMFFAAAGGVPFSLTCSSVLDSETVTVYRAGKPPLDSEYPEDVTHSTQQGSLLQLLLL